ncbi:LOW QUALITY PROTEIN: uncharacterized protein [Medicago truncatula]|uniref:LOW QUALITY PROTEIN: uncharacterized protein n=1 Tax=Medicago truncatula TaxID=3880 RepID=UPI0019675242|nr:LOW QUALITY PROTEIN: uncharacterized protein LOC25484815 [Medicago truncatula]
MLLAGVASLIVYSRETVTDNQIQNTPSLAKVWNVLEVRILVALSLYMQIVLIFLGNRRKYIANIWLQLLNWLTYLSADWTATLALGVLSKDHKTDPNFVIMAIWAPFLLVHLGGPDTITAYSLEDNELWYRHMLVLLSQLTVAVYVVYRSWNGSPLNYVNIPIFVAGIVKYGERSWSLWSGSSKGFRESILPPPDPGPNYAKFMDDYTAKKDEGYHVTLEEVDETTPSLLEHNYQGETKIPNPNIPHARALHDGLKFYKIPECLFADLILSFQDHKTSQLFFQNMDWEHAFEVIAVELGLVYDMLYTKAVLTYSKRGIFLKSVSFFCTLFALISFSFLIYKGDVNQHDLHLNYDHIITILLFTGAIILEIYAVIVLLSSSRAMFWFSNHNSRRIHLLYKFISCFQFFLNFHTLSRGLILCHNSTSLDFVKDEPVKCIEIQKFLRIYNFFEKFYYKKTHEVCPELRKLIFDQLMEKSKEATDVRACKKLCSQKGDQVLDKWNCHVQDINRSIREVEFDQSILLWHIATDLCNSSDDNEPQNLNPATLQSRYTSQLLSDYMIYLLVICPFLLPNGIGQIRFEDTCAEVGELLKERKYIKERSQVCKMILRVNTSIPPSEVKGDRSKSVLFDACRLAKSLQSLETEENWSKEQKWEMISHVWVEMLCHAASQCRGLHHARQLSQGGELLTHVWLLMAHLGITEQFQISKGHVRAKLKLS